MTDVALRPARADDAAWLSELVVHDAIAPFLAAARSSAVDEVAAEIARAEHDPEAFGVLVIEASGERVGTIAWERVNRRSRIASVSGLALEPVSWGRGIAAAAVELLVSELLDVRGLHRVQLEVYGFNEHGAAFFERAGFVREGVRRLAYWRDGRWVDGILYGLVDEDRAAR